VLLWGNFTFPLSAGASVAASEAKVRVSAADRAVAQHDDAIIASFDAILYFDANGVGTVSNHPRARRTSNGVPHTWIDGDPVNRAASSAAHPAPEY
jgi:hypothetical protein